MPKNIIIFSDGTGNSGIKNRGTNVYKLFEAIDLHSHHSTPDIPEQVTIYDDGVGTEKFKPLKIAGGALGIGLKRNVRELYTSIARVYNPGDALYFFGFSRGAFTVRTLVGFICDCGIIDRTKFNHDKELIKKTKEAYKKYRLQYQSLLGKIWYTLIGKKASKTPAWNFRDNYSVKLNVNNGNQEIITRQIPIQFIGVWDTVDAVGFPIDKVADWINDYIRRFKFYDYTLRPEVSNAYHAISIDDERKTFHPVMWDMTEDDSRLEQVWFSGVHSNVGGGYPKQGMSLVSLHWMINKAKSHGLHVSQHDQKIYFQKQNVNDKLYDSRSGTKFFYRYEPRNIAKICAKSNGLKPRIHESVFDRIDKCTEGYAPGNIPLQGEITATDTVQPHLSRLYTLYQKKLSQNSSLLDIAQKAISLRSISYWLFLLTLVGAISIAVGFNMHKSGLWITIANVYSGKYANLIHSLFGTLWFFLVLLSLAISSFFYFGGYILRKHIDTTFSEFWYTLLKEWRETEKRITRV